jgi:hypothetical protein
MTVLVELALIVAAAAALAVCVAALPNTAGGRRARVRRAQPGAPAQLERLERLVGTAAVSATEAHAYLRPVLVEIAGQRLRASGRALERIDDATGRSILGEQLWELVRPGRPFPTDRHGPGVSERQLSEFVEILERL